MSQSTIWPLIQQSFQAFSPFYQQEIQSLFGEGRFQQGDWVNCFNAYGLEPQSLTAEFLHAQNPYTNLKARQESLAATAERGFLTAVSPGSYHLSETGRKGIAAFFETAVSALSKVEPLPTADLERLATLLHRVIKTTLNTSEPAQKAQLHLSRRTDPGMTAHPTARLDQYFTDLSRYRDDAHLAAWLPAGVSGPAWETLTILWHDGLNTPAAVAEQLTGRGYSTNEYAAAFQELVGKGWVAAQDETFVLTENGRIARETAETTTDLYFHVGFSALNENEQAEFAALVTRLNSSLQSLAADRNAAERADLWPLANTISGSLFTLTREAVNPINEAAGINQRGLPFALLFTHSLHPEANSGEAMRRRFPYATAKSWEKPMQQLAEKGLLVANGDNTYYLSENGRNLNNHLLTTFRNKLNDLTTALSDGLETAELDKLAGLLRRVVDEALNSPEPPGAANLRVSRNLAPAEDAIALSQIDQFIDDLNAFRDDSHLAAFQPYSVSGHAWELLGFLWRGTVQNAAEMAEKAAHRGHTAESYAQALGELMERGWITAVSETTYQLTETGQLVRQQAETLTDRYFYAPWATLNNAETQQMRDLLTRLDAGLKTLTGEK